MRDLVGFLRQRLVVEEPRGVRVEAEIELINPAEVKAGAVERVGFADYVRVGPCRDEI